MVVQLQPASYKGFRFLVPDTRTQGGQKTASHEFPGSNRRSVQDLGQLPDTFVVVAIVHGDNYIADVARLKQILSEGGFGDFVHPSQGTFRVKSTGYTLSESDADKGRARFEINFATASPDIQPVATRSNQGGVARQAETVKSALERFIEAFYKLLIRCLETSPMLSISWRRLPRPSNKMPASSRRTRPGFRPSQGPCNRSTTAQRASCRTLTPWRQTCSACSTPLTASRSQAGIRFAS